MNENDRKDACFYLEEYQRHLTRFFTEGENLQEPEKRLLAKLVVEVDTQAKTELEEQALHTYRNGRDEFRRDFFQKLYQ